MDCWLWSRNCYCHNFWRCTVLDLWVSQESTSSNVSLLPPSGSIFIYIRADKHACDFQHLLLFFLPENSGIKEINGASICIRRQPL